MSGRSGSGVEENTGESAAGETDERDPGRDAREPTSVARKVHAEVRMDDAGSPTVIEAIGGGRYSLRPFLPETLDRSRPTADLRKPSS